MNFPKYAKFDISEVTYKVVNGQDIKAYVLTPKNISSGKHAIVVKFHGGFFVCSSPIQLGCNTSDCLPRSVAEAYILIGIHNGHLTTVCSTLRSL